jgi:DNA-binding XRE family transcriptional regulator
MPFVPSEAVHGLLVRARSMLGMTQEEFANAFDSSRRTVLRMEAGASWPTLAQLHKIACAVSTHDAQLAAQIAAESGETLESLGIVSPAAEPPPLARVRSPGAMPPIHLMVESIVCAAAEALETTPRGVRHVLRAAFGRAHEMGLTVGDVHGALSTPPPVKQKPKEPADDGRTRVEETTRAARRSKREKANSERLTRRSVD